MYSSCLLFLLYVTTINDIISPIINVICIWFANLFRAFVRVCLVVCMCAVNVYVSIYMVTIWHLTVHPLFFTFTHIKSDLSFVDVCGLFWRRSLLRRFGSIAARESFVEHPDTPIFAPDNSLNLGKNTAESRWMGKKSKSEDKKKTHLCIIYLILFIVEHWTRYTRANEQTEKKTDRLIHWAHKTVNVKIYSTVLFTE